MSEHRKRFDIAVTKLRAEVRTARAARQIDRALGVLAEAQWIYLRACASRRPDDWTDLVHHFLCIAIASLNCAASDLQAGTGREADAPRKGSRRSSRRS